LYPKKYKRLQFDANFNKNTGDYKVGLKTVVNFWTYRIKNFNDTLALALLHMTESWTIKETDERDTAVISSCGMQNTILRIVREFKKTLDF
jgi:hypothetical protein